jgi:SAM-dependent methyltransferase
MFQMDVNVDAKTVEGFGEEWTRFDQSELDAGELADQFERYFKVFPWNSVPQNAEGFDLGCGSGRWANLAAQRVGRLHCIDASPAALEVARRNLSSLHNVEFHEASVDSIPVDNGSMDFGYSLGVLHHIPDTAEGIRACVAKLRRGAPFLVYLYYAFDNRPGWFKVVWRISDVGRQVLSALPFGLKRVGADVIAFSVYLPLSRTSRMLENLGMNVESLPLSTYRRHSFYTMRTDALDRFGTRVEHRFTRQQIKEMMEAAGLRDVKFSDAEPYWCAVGFKS